jgi:hypothetical protein
MKTYRFTLALFCLSIALLAGKTWAKQNPDVTVEAVNLIRSGWMAGGYGNYRISIKNNSNHPITLVKWTAHWEINGTALPGEWGGNIQKSLNPNAVYNLEQVGYLPQDVAQKAGALTPFVAGTVEIEDGGKNYQLPYLFAVPVAKLPEPLVLVTSRYVGCRLMKSRYKDFTSLHRALRWMDDCYVAMRDLTGNTPYQGRRIIYTESPPNPYWAYAGESITLNTDYVGSTIQDFNKGLISFGWVHEMGHDFDDGIGQWYIWNGPAAEFWANFKLTYALTHIPSNIRIKWDYARGYPTPGKRVVMTGEDLLLKFFGLWGDEYLADPSREWQTMSSDDIQTFFQRIQIVYGWDVFKQFFRTYERLKAENMHPPSKPEEKLSLIAAILNSLTKGDLVPLFQRWRFPVTEEGVKAVADKYHIADLSARTPLKFHSKLSILRHQGETKSE